MDIYTLLYGGSDGKESACNAGDLGSIPGLGKSPREGHGNPLDYCCLENPYGQRSLAGYSPWVHKESDRSKHSTYLKWIINKDLLYSVWNSVQHSVLCGSLDGRGVWGRMDTCVCMAESLCCSPETITTLLIDYTPKQNKKFFKIFFKT